MRTYLLNSFKTTYCQIIFKNFVIFMNHIKQDLFELSNCFWNIGLSCFMSKIDDFFRQSYFSRYPEKIFTSSHVVQSDCANICSFSFSPYLVNRHINQCRPVKISKVSISSTRFVSGKRLTTERRFQNAHLLS